MTMAAGVWLTLILLELAAQDMVHAQTFDTNSTYQTAANFSDGIVASKIYVCDDVVSPRYACPNTSWTLLPASDGPMCLQLVDILETFDSATQSCGNMGGRLLTIMSETRQKAVESFIQFRYAGEPWIGFGRNLSYSYYTFYWLATGPNPLTYINSDSYGYYIDHCCGPDCAYLTYPYRKWEMAFCTDLRPYICERDKVCVDGFTGDNCDQVCHCYGEPYKGGQPCKYGCESGWTGPYCYTPLTRARLGANVQLRMTLTMSPGLRAQGVSPYDCIASSGDGLYQLVLTDSDGCPAGRSTVISELRGHNGTVRSDPFQLFAFAGQNSLQIACSFQFCFTREEALCTDRCNTRRMARLTTTGYGDTTTYGYWTSTLYRKKREASSPEYAGTVIEIIKESISTDTKQKTSEAATNTLGPVAWARLLTLIPLCGFNV